MTNGGGKRNNPGYRGGEFAQSDAGGNTIGGGQTVVVSRGMEREALAHQYHHRRVCRHFPTELRLSNFNATGHRTSPRPFPACA